MTAAAAYGATPPLALGKQVGYGVGQIAGQVFRDVPSLLLLFFMTTVLGIAPAVAGTAIFVPKLIFGVGCDMAAGVLSDRWQARIPRRRWLLAGAALSPVAMILLFHVPEAATPVRLAYVFVAFSLYMAVFATFSVPYLAIAGDLASTPEQRTVLMAWRLAFTAVGVLIASALSPTIVSYAGGGQAGYETMARVLAAICPVALIVAYFGIGKPTGASAAPQVRLTLREAVSVLLRPRFSVLLGVNIMQLAGSGMGYASLLYFLAYNMGRGDALAVIGGVVIAACAGILVGQPIWVWIAKRWGKIAGYVVGSLVYSVAYIVWALSADASIEVAFFLSFVAGIGNSGWAMLGFSMVADIAGDDEAHAGLYSAAWIAADKVGFALGGTLIVGLVLSGFGFDSARAVQGLPQSDLALTGVMIAFGFLPATLNIVGAAILARYGTR